MAMSGMRSFAKSKVALLIFGVLIVAFGAGVGMNDPFSGISGGGFVRAGDRSIGARDANRVLNQQLERIRQEEGQNISQRDAAEKGIVNQVVQEMVQETMMLAHADKIGVQASAKSVSDFLVTAPRFKDALGRVNMQAVSAYAAEQNMTARQFEDVIRDSITSDYVNRAAFAGLTPPKVLSDPIAAYLGERRTFGMARATPGAVPPPKEPTEAELNAYYTAHAAQFAVPELRQISIIDYSPQDFVDKVQVTEAQIKSAYDRRIREFSAPETREFQQFTSADRAAVQAVIDTIKQGVTPADAVKRTAGVDLAALTVKPADLADAEYSKAVFAVPPGEAFGPIQVGTSWHGFLIDKITPGVATPMAQVSDQIRSQLALAEAVRLFNDSAETFSDLVGGGASLEEISTEIGAPVLMLGPVARNGANPAYGQNQLLMSKPDALAHMFEAKVGETSEVIEGDNTRAVLRLDGIVPGKTRPLEEVRSQVRTLQMSEQAEKAMIAAADALLAKVKAGMTLEQASREAKFVYTPTPEVSRAQPPQGLDRALVEGAFKLAAKETAVVKAETGEPYIVHVETVTPYDPARDPQLALQAQRVIRDSIGRDLGEVYGRGVRNAVKVKINEGAIQDYLKSFTADDAQ